METPATETAFKAIFDGLLAGQEAEAAQQYRAITAGRVNEKCLQDPEQFYFQLWYPYEQFLEGLIATGAPNAKDKDRLSFLLQHSQFVDCHLERLFQAHEGRMGCADKARTCIRSLMRFFQTGQEIAFNYEQEYTYHLPSKIFSTHASIYSFFEGLRQLFYGDPRAYLTALDALTEPIVS